ncbi:phosphate uptake regulator PhoU [Candidatus Thorarchaeota archaeon]|nr:MAG: phosphate uptake regulator PhoU [Candidatus Thorarchaeota archaeon]
MNTWMIVMHTTRKLNKVRNSFYVYLPKEWIDEYGLDEKSEVRIDRVADGALHVLPSTVTRKQVGPLKLKIEKDESQNVVNLLVGSYIVGADDLELEFTEEIDMATRGEISAWVEKLKGYDILDEHSKNISISDILTTEKEKDVIRKMLRRQFSTTKYMLNGMMEIIETSKLGDHEHIISRDEEVDKNRYFVERVCHLVLRDPSYARDISLSATDALNFSLAAKYVERIADHICGGIQELVTKTSVEAELKKLAAKVAQLYEETTSTFFSIDKKGKRVTENLPGDSSQAFVALRSSSPLIEALENLESARSKKSPSEVLLAMHLERIASYCADIIEIGINRIIEAQL